MFTAFLIAAAMTPDALPRYPGPALGGRASERYEICIELINEDLEIGRIAAEQWAAEGGGAAAGHCRAVGDLKSGKPKTAAIRLLDVAERNDAGDALTRAKILEQAALAWLAAEDAKQAGDAIAAAQALAPNSGELSLTAGVVHAANEKWSAAIKSITAAEEAGFQSADGFVARASGQMALLKHDLAAEDVVAALKIDPFNLDALVLRGQLHTLGVEIEANYQRRTK